ncbi:MAG: ester cyclase [Candidatus Geothermarchaeales archaeon]
MSVEENLCLLDKTLEVFNAHDLDSLLGFYADSVVRYSTASPEPLKGPAAIREHFKASFTAFPDYHYEKERAFGQGDWICLEGTFTATHRGPLQGPDGRTIPATNRTVRGRDCTLVKFEGGKITEVHEYSDQLGFLAQLGVKP